MKWTVTTGDALEVMRGMADNSVSLIATDPPFYKVKNAEWDRQWSSPEKFLAWIGLLCAEWQRILKPNGSLYVFASPQMARGVGNVIAGHFNILTDIRWRKPAFSTKAEMFRKEDLRAPFPASETIFFAEHFNADNIAKGEAGYEARCQQLCRAVFQIGPLSEAVGVTRAQIARLIVSDYKNIESAQAQASNWILGKNIPNPVDFQRLRSVLPIQGDYNALRREFEAKRQEYEALRREYETLRRPFNATPDAPYTDVWDFPTVNDYAGKHECEKPFALMQHIIRLSSRPGDVVFDCFCGSGVTGEAAVAEGREFIGVEKSAWWANKSRQRVARIAGGTAHVTTSTEAGHGFPLFTLPFTAAPQET